MNKKYSQPDEGPLSPTPNLSNQDKNTFYFTMNLSCFVTIYILFFHYGLNIHKFAIYFLDMGNYKSAALLQAINLSVILKARFLLLFLI